MSNLSSLVGEICGCVLRPYILIVGTHCDSTLRENDQHLRQNIKVSSKKKKGGVREGSKGEGEVVVGKGEVDFMFIV